MRLRPALAVPLAALIMAALTGCSRKAENIVGADRLIRGPAGLGQTTRLVRPPDRDAFVENGTTVFDELLLAGSSGPFEARTLLFVGTVNLPDTTLAGFTPQGISLEFTSNLNLGFASTTVNVFQTTVWDTTTVAWPGPAAGALLGSATDDRALAPFSVPLNVSFPQVVQWKTIPALGQPRFLVQTPGGQPLAAYVAGSVKLRVRYTHDGAAGAVLDSVDSPVTQDLYVHSPLSPVPNGTDTTLVLGGLFETELAMHFPVDSIPADVSVNEATLVLHLQPGSEVPTSADSLGRIEVRGIRAAWGEGVVERSAIPGVDSTVAVTYSDPRRVFSVGASTLAIPLPGFLVRAWAATPSTNGGVLVTLVNRQNLGRAILIGARESVLPPELHVTYTELPPGRFARRR